MKFYLPIMTKLAKSNKNRTTVVVFSMPVTFPCKKLCALYQQADSIVSLTSSRRQMHSKTEIPYAKTRVFSA